jgi:hypothetical protein
MYFSRHNVAYLSATDNIFPSILIHGKPGIISNSGEIKYLQGINSTTLMIFLYQTL